MEMRSMQPGKVAKTIEAIADQVKDLDPNEPRMINMTKYFNRKYAKHIPAGWYGFAIENLPYSWAVAIEKVIDTLLEYDPTALVLQAKLKFGGLRLYISTSFEEASYQIRAAIWYFESKINTQRVTTIKEDY